VKFVTNRPFAGRRSTGIGLSSRLHQDVAAGHRHAECSARVHSMPPPPRDGGFPVTKHPQHHVASLARLAETGKPLNNMNGCSETWRDLMSHSGT
jgi:hypothetical protein